MQLSNLHILPQLFIVLSFEAQKTALEEAGIKTAFSNQLTSFYTSGITGWDRRRPTRNILCYSNKYDEVVTVEIKCN